MTKPNVPPDDGASFLTQLKAQFAAQMPTRETLQQQRWLGPWAHRIAEHDLWHMKTESMARGVAIGMFWAFIFPVAQILFAAVHCVWWRGNIPVAAGVTLITNPLTIGGWLYLAYQVGSVFITAPAVAATATGSGFLGMLGSFGWPTVLGMGMFAFGGAASGYLLVRLGSAAWFHYRVARRARRRSV